VNTVAVSFNTIMGQMTEMSQRKNKPGPKLHICLLFRQQDGVNSVVLTTVRGVYSAITARLVPTE